VNRSLHIEEENSGYSRDRSHKKLNHPTGGGKFPRVYKEGEREVDLVDNYGLRFNH
jgi:hypothetical protein